MMTTYATVTEVIEPMPAWHRVRREALSPWQRYIGQPLPGRQTRTTSRIINRLIFRCPAWLRVAAIVACLGSHPAQAQCCGCIDAANLAGRVTTQSVNAYTSAAIAVQAGIIVTALQGHAAQTSANIRGTITGQGLIAEAMDNHETQRQLQGDRIQAAKAYQFSTLLCQGATGSGIAIAMTVAAGPDAACRAAVNLDPARRDGEMVSDETTPNSIRYDYFVKDLLTGEWRRDAVGGCGTVEFPAVDGAAGNAVDGVMAAHRQAYPPALRWWIHDIDYDNDSYSAIVLDDDGHIKMSRYLPLFSEGGAREEARIWSMDIGMPVQLFRGGVEIAGFGCD